MQIEVAIGTAVVTATVIAFLGWLYTSGIWKIRIRRYKRNWDPIVDEINSILERMFGDGSLAPPPEAGVDRGDVDIAKAQVFVRRSDGLTALSHMPKKVILVASDQEIKQGAPYNESIVNFIRQLLSFRGDPFLAYFSSDLGSAVESFCLDHISYDMKLERSLIPIHDGDEEMESIDLLYAVEDVYNAGELSEFTKTVAESYAGVTNSPRMREQTATEFTKRYKELEKKFAGLYCKTSERQLICLRNGLSGILIPPRFQPSGRVENWTIFFWKANQTIVARAKVASFHVGPFAELWRNHQHSLLKIPDTSTSEAKDTHEAWAAGLGGYSGRLKDGRGRPLDLILVEIHDFYELARPIEAKMIKQLGAPNLSRVCRLVLSQVNSLLAHAMPRLSQTT